MTPEHKQQAKQLIADWTNVSRTSTPAVWFLNADCMAGFLRDLIDAPESEPVATVTGYYGGYLSISTIDGRVLPAGTALYLAPPAPSVPPVRSTGQWESSRIADYNRGWNACREAMLAATPQQEPLSDERILSIGKRFLDRGYYPFEGLQPWVYSFARAIEREILGGGHE